MSSEPKPEVVTSAAYHADTDDEYDFKTSSRSAMMDYDADTDEEDFVASPDTDQQKQSGSQDRDTSGSDSNEASSNDNDSDRGNGNPPTDSNENGDNNNSTMMVQNDVNCSNVGVAVTNQNQLISSETETNVPESVSGGDPKESGSGVGTSEGAPLPPQTARGDAEGETSDVRVGGGKGVNDNVEVNYELISSETKTLNLNLKASFEAQMQTLLQTANMDRDDEESDDDPLEDNVITCQLLQAIDACKGFFSQSRDEQVLKLDMNQFQPALRNFLYEHAVALLRKIQRLPIQQCASHLNYLNEIHDFEKNGCGILFQTPTAAKKGKGTKRKRNGNGKNGNVKKNDLQGLKRKFPCECFHCLNTADRALFLPLFRELTWQGLGADDKTERICTRSTLLKISKTEQIFELPDRNKSYRDHTAGVGRHLHYATAEAKDYFPKWDDDRQNWKKAKRKIDKATPDLASRLQTYNKYYYANSPQGVYFVARILPLKLFLLAYLEKYQFQHVQETFRSLLKILEQFRTDSNSNSFKHSAFLKQLACGIGTMRAIATKQPSSASGRGNVTLQKTYESQWSSRKTGVKKEEAMSRETVVFDVKYMLGTEKGEQLLAHIVGFVQELFDNFRLPDNYFTERKPQPNDTKKKVTSWLETKFLDVVCKKIDSLFLVNDVQDVAVNPPGVIRRGSPKWRPGDSWGDEAKEAKTEAECFIKIAIDSLAQTLLDHVENWRGFYEEEYLNDRDT